MDQYIKASRHHHDWLHNALLANKLHFLCLVMFGCRRVPAKIYLLPSSFLPLWQNWQQCCQQDLLDLHCPRHISLVRWQNQQQQAAHFPPTDKLKTQVNLQMKSPHCFATFLSLTEPGISLQQQCQHGRYAGPKAGHTNTNIGDCRSCFNIVASPISCRNSFS